MFILGIIIGAAAMYYGKSKFESFVKHVKAWFDSEAKK